MTFKLDITELCNSRIQTLKVDVVRYNYCEYSFATCPVRHVPLAVEKAHVFGNRLHQVDVCCAVAAAVFARIRPKTTHDVRHLLFLNIEYDPRLEIGNLRSTIQQQYPHSHRKHPNVNLYESAQQHPWFQVWHRRPQSDACTIFNSSKLKNMNMSERALHQMRNQCMFIINVTVTHRMPGRTKGCLDWAIHPYNNLLLWRLVLKKSRRPRPNSAILDRAQHRYWRSTRPPYKCKMRAPRCDR